MFGMNQQIPWALAGGYTSLPTNASSSTDSTKTDLPRHTSTHSNTTFRDHSQNQPFFAPAQQQQQQQQQQGPHHTTHSTQVNLHHPSQQRVLPPINTQSLAPGQTPSAIDNSAFVQHHQQHHPNQQNNQPQPMTPATPDLRAKLKEYATARANALLSASSPAWEKFWASVAATVTAEIYSLSENYNQELSKAKELFDRSTQEVRAEKIKMKEEIGALTTKCQRLEADNESTHTKLGQALKHGQHFRVACQGLTVQNEELHKQVEVLKRKLESGEQSLSDGVKGISDCTVGSIASESNVPPEVLDQLRQSVASGYEKSLVHSTPLIPILRSLASTNRFPGTLEVIKYKRRCAELKRQLEVGRGVGSISGFIRDYC
jgi:hypothetical protein